MIDASHICERYLLLLGAHTFSDFIYWVLKSVHDFVENEQVPVAPNSVTPRQHIALHNTPRHATHSAGRITISNGENVDINEGCCVRTTTSPEPNSFANCPRNNSSSSGVTATLAPGHQVSALAVNTTPDGKFTYRANWPDVVM